MDDITVLSDEELMQSAPSQSTQQTQNTDTTAGSTTATTTSSEQTTETAGTNSTTNTEQLDPNSSTTEQTSTAGTEANSSGLELPEDFDYKAAYQKLVAPFKANGKMITVRNPEEVISLMQMGVGYSAKAAKLNRAAQLEATLTKEGIDETALGLLIDLHKKNPEAIQKYLKDAAVDPLDIDVTSESTYVNNNRLVSDAEIAFSQALDTVATTDLGKQFLSEINSTWDTAAKDAIYHDTSILDTLNEQYASGVYRMITDEMARLKAVGVIPQNTPFLHAYQHAGNALLNAGNANTGTNPNTPIATKVAGSTNPNMGNSDKAAKAALPRAGSKTMGNSLAELSDEEFLKRM